MTDLAAFFENCHGAVADSVNDHFDDPAAEWLPIVLVAHIDVLTETLTAGGEDLQNP